MTIRARLTIWYGAILTVSLAVMAGVSHYEFTEQQQRMREQHLEAEPAWGEVGELLLLYGLPTALLILAGGWVLLRKSLAPVTALARAAESIHLDNLKQRLPRTHNGDELDRLTEIFNAMIARLEDSVAHVREFTLHASHELKTPLTVMRGEIESALRGGDQVIDQRELMASQLDEIQRLTRIVDGLALLAKADAGQTSFQRQPLRLDELVKDSFADAQVLARPQQITVELPACDAIAMQGDRHRLRQLLLNLTENAIRHNQPQGNVSMSLSRHNGAAQLKISNSGPGIAPEILPRVFDRFFRGDLARGCASEGCGLGLSIAQWIVQTHGGQIVVASEVGKSTTVTVTLPLHP